MCVPPPHGERRAVDRALCSDPPGDERPAPKRLAGAMWCCAVAFATAAARALCSERTPAQKWMAVHARLSIPTLGACSGGTRHMLVCRLGAQALEAIVGPHLPRGQMGRILGLARPLSLFLSMPVFLSVPLHTHLCAPFCVCVLPLRCCLFFACISFAVTHPSMTCSMWRSSEQDN